MSIADASNPAITQDIVVATSMPYVEISLAQLKFNCRCHVLAFTNNISDTSVIMLPLHVDIDECQQQPTLCGSNAACNNQPGTFRCECLEGYQFSADGRTCVGKFKFRTFFIVFGNLKKY